MRGIVFDSSHIHEDGHSDNQLMFLFVTFRFAAPDVALKFQFGIIGDGSTLTRYTKTATNRLVSRSVGSWVCRSVGWSVTQSASRSNNGVKLHAVTI